MSTDERMTPELVRLGALLGFSREEAEALRHIGDAEAAQRLQREVESRMDAADSASPKQWIEVLTYATKALIASTSPLGLWHELARHFRAALPRTGHVHWLPDPEDDLEYRAFRIGDGVAEQLGLSDRSSREWRARLRVALSELREEHERDGLAAR